MHPDPTPTSTTPPEIHHIHHPAPAETLTGGPMVIFILFWMFWGVIWGLLIGYLVWG